MPSHARTLGVLCVFLVTTAEAHAAPTAPSPPVVTPADAFIRIAPRFLSMTFTRNGQEVGPGFLAADLAAAVHGVPTAEEHAERARIFGIARLATAVAGLGFILGNVAYQHRQGGDWRLTSATSVTPAVLNLGWIVSLAGTATLGRLMQREMFQSVNAYNYFLINAATGGDDVD